MSWKIHFLLRREIATFYQGKCFVSITWPNCFYYCHSSDLREPSRDQGTLFVQRPGNIDIACIWIYPKNWWELKRPKRGGTLTFFGGGTHVISIFGAAPPPYNICASGNGARWLQYIAPPQGRSGETNISSIYTSRRHHSFHSALASFVMPW